MPGFNQTGPAGQGPMTGRKEGRCTNFGANQKNQTSDVNENSNDNMPENMQGNGFGFGRGREEEVEEASVWDDKIVSEEASD